MSNIKLYPYQKEICDSVNDYLENDNKCCVIMGTGLGKTYVYLSVIIDYLQNNNSKDALILVPSNAIKYSVENKIEELISSNEFPKGFFNRLQVGLYQSFIRKTDVELQSMNIGLLVVDEFHHITAPEWQKPIAKLQQYHSDLKILGVSATPIRALGTKDEENVAQTFFDGNVAATYNLSDAINDHLIKPFNYHRAKINELIRLDELLILKKDKFKNYLEQKNKIESLKKRILSLSDSSVTNLLANTLKSNGKYHYFCPRGTDIQKAQREFLELLPDYLKNNCEFYSIYNKDSKESIQKNINCFENDLSLDGQVVSSKLRIMFSIDMFGEGVHSKNVDGVILGRSTESNIVFTQQIGRANSITNTDKPLIIDLVDNISSIISLISSYKHKQVNLFDNPEYTKTQDFGDLLLDVDNEDLDSLLAFGISIEEVDILKSLRDLELEFELPLKKKIEEYAVYLRKSGKILRDKDYSQKFSDGTNMYRLVPYHLEKLKVESQKGNLDAKYIIEVYEKTRPLSLEVKIHEYAQYIKKSGSHIIKKHTVIYFSNGDMMNNFVYQNKKEIISYANNGNEDARVIVDSIEKHNLSFEEKLLEYHKYIEKNNEYVYQSQKDIKFSDGVSMGNFINVNIKKIKEYALAGNLDAKFIYDFYLEHNATYKYLSFEDKKHEYALYIKKTGTYVRTNDGKILFSDNTKMCSFYKSYEERLKNLALLGDEDAKLIVETFKSQFVSQKELLSLDAKIQELAMYIKKNNCFPRSEDNVRFSDNTLMSVFFTNQKEKIEKIQSLDAKYIMDFWRNRQLTFEEKLSQVVTFIKMYDCLPKTKDFTICFTNGDVMTFFLKSCKEKIYEYAQNGNNDAKIIIDELEKRKKHLRDYEYYRYVYDSECHFKKVEERIKEGRQHAKKL